MILAFLAGLAGGLVLGIGITIALLWLLAWWIGHNEPEKAA